MKPPHIATIAIDCPLRKGFDYLIPKEMRSSSLLPGTRVLVSFGRRAVTGIVLDTKHHSDFPEHKLKPIQSRLDETPVLDEHLMQLGHFTARYYAHPIGETLMTMLPVLLRDGAPAKRKQNFCYRLLPQADLTTLRTNAKSQLALITHLKQGELTPQAIKDHNLSTSALRSLQDKGLVEKVVRDACAKLSPSALQPPLHLNPEQASALKALTQSLDAFAPFLLYGVTGSGKTEVYLQIINKVIKQGKQALVLVPEITLTPQTLRRFESRIDGTIVSLHSGMNNTERLNHWLMAKTHEADVVIGTRSALFTPFANLGIIIIDEEHDASFKQQEGLRYHARDLSIIRAKELAIPVILGTATPSLETYANVQKGKYTELALSQRAGAASLPRFHLIDTRSKKLHQGLSLDLLTQMQKHLDKDQQVLLFLNRRGYAPSLICFSCGTLAGCPQCDARLTYHKRKNHLICHHCGYTMPQPKQCTKCGSEHLQTLGQGTERIEETLQAHFPGVDIIRIDRDSTRRKDSMQKHLDKIHQGGKKILVGTQMLAKGHHFPGVSLVGILNADHGLLCPDFRAPERIGQLLLQVAGRAGRADIPGEVFVQTVQPTNPLFHLLFQQDYSRFLQTLLQERQEVGWPPFSALALIRAESVQLTDAQHSLLTIKELCESHLPTHCVLLGPIPASIARVSNRFRVQLLLQAPSRQTLQACLPHLIQAMTQSKIKRNVRLSVDVDPMEVA